MGSLQSLRVHDVGACTPLGFCAASTAAAVWAGISRISAPHVPVRGTSASVYQAVCPIVDADAALAQRLTSLAYAALTPMLAKLEDWPGCLTVFVALPAHAAASTLVTEVIQGLQQSLTRLRGGLRQSLSLKPLTAHPGDFAQTLQTVARYLSAPAAPALCIVGGVDSNVSLCRLEALRAQQELYDIHTGEGVIPGEAAAFLTVSPNKGAALRPILAHIDAWQQSSSMKAVQGEQAPSALGLQRNVEDLLPKGASPALWVSDATGELWRASAQANIATSPALGSFVHTQLLEPARLMGESGVAFAPLACAVALHGIRQGLVNATQALLTVQDRQSAAAWLLTARCVHDTALACDGPWRHRPKRAV